MSDRPTVVLFDIDGTLVSTSGLARSAMEQAVTEEYGDAGAFGFSFGGMTDFAIFRRALDSMGIALERPRVQATLDRYIALLQIIMRDNAKAGGTKHRCYPGAVACVQHVAGQPHIAAGIGTGNIEAGARLKLAPFGFNELLAFGGYGSDAEAREEVIAAGASRGADKLGRPLADCRLVIVGDTPHDVSAAHANGGTCVAVCTGSATAEELHGAGADFVFDDLTSAAASHAIVTGIPLVTAPAAEPNSQPVKG
jgi:phosphoglycolate phosphatase